MAAAGADFFELQDQARRATRRLVVLYLVALVLVAAAISVIVALFLAVWILFWGGPLPEGVAIDYGRIVRSYWSVLTQGIPWQIHAAVGGAAAAMMVFATLRRAWQLSAGGEAVAELLGALPLERSRATVTETRLLNVVEEMAIASGVAVPPVYVLRDERAINALAAGYEPNEAVVVVTQGALARLTRDELQGVIAHEFSHILHGDMRLNVRLLALLYGIVFLGQAGQYLVRVATEGAIGVKREAQRLAIGQLAVGALLALVGWFGLLVARFIKSAIARQREFLADAASVQFTRNPEGIAGALDSTLSLRLGTGVMNLHAEEASHMFFGQAVSSGLGAAFATHPPIQERIRRVHPRFNREEYRATREGLHERREIAVIDGQGNVVKTVRGTAKDVAAAGVVAIAAAVGAPTRSHLEVAKQLLASVPPATRERIKTPEGAAQLAFALALEKDEAARAAELKVLEQRRDSAFAAGARAAWQEIEPLGRAYRLPLVELALPVLKGQKQDARDAFLADYSALIEADKRVTLTEFVLYTYLKQHLREGAGRPIGSQIPKLEEAAADAHALLSLVAYACRGNTEAAFAAGAPALNLGLKAPLPLAEISTQRVGEALERLRVLAPLAKPRVLKACLDAVAADGKFRLVEAELVRIVAATLDCPLPPVIAALDPTTLDLA